MARTGRLLLWAYLGVFFLSYLGPIVEGDFFWHLISGKETLQGITPPGGTQWLGQVFLYLIYKLSGYAGVVFFRAAAYTAVLGILFLWMRRLGVEFYRALLFLLLPAHLFLSFPSERPQLFSFVFFPLTVYLLEDHRKRPGYRYVWLLIPLFIIWANTHAGFLLGAAALWAYLIAGGIGYIRGKYALRTLAALAVISIAPIIAVFAAVGSGALPLISGLLRAVFSTAPYMKTLIEYLSPLSALSGLGLYFPEYWIFLVLSLVVVITHLKRMPLEHILLLGIFAVLSLRFLRFMPFFLMLVPFVSTWIKGEREGESREEGSRWPGARWLAPAVFAAILVLWVAFTPIKIGPGISEEFPKGAADFIKARAPRAKVFNYQGWGGYLKWDAPGLEIFLPAQGVTPEINDAYERIIRADTADIMGKPAWKSFLEAYGLEMIVMPERSPATGEKYPLIEALEKDGDWRPIYSDNVVTIFSRLPF